MGRRNRWARDPETGPGSVAGVEVAGEEQSAPDATAWEEEPAEPEAAPPVVVPASTPAPVPPSGCVRVRVRGPGGVVTALGMHAAGEVFALSLTEVLSLGEAVERLE